MSLALYSADALGIPLDEAERDIADTMSSMDPPRPPLPPRTALGYAAWDEDEEENEWRILNRW